MFDEIKNRSFNEELRVVKRCEKVVETLTHDILVLQCNIFSCPADRDSLLYLSSLCQSLENKIVKYNNAVDKLNLERRFLSSMQKDCIQMSISEVSPDDSNI